MVMCLGVPGQIASIEEGGAAASGDSGLRMGKVSFGGIRREVCLAYVPEARVGDWVLVHVGFALHVIDEAEAREIFDALVQMTDAAARGPAEPRP